MTLLDLLVPPRCLVCGTTYSYGPRPLAELVTEPALCRSCREACLPEEHANRCPVCGIPLPQFITTCERCRRESFAFDRAIAVRRYAGIAEQVIQRFKFGRHRSLARVIGGSLVPAVERFAGEASALVPAPSRPGTVRSRGFAGAELIAREASRATGIPVARILRLRGSRAQKSLSYEQRRENARRAVRTTPGAVCPAHAVLIDDVFTTGTTADACARALTEAGARSVTVVVFALEY